MNTTNCSDPLGISRVLVLDPNSNRVIGEEPRFAARFSGYPVGERVPARPAFVAPVVPPANESVEDMLRDLGAI